MRVNKRDVILEAVSKSDLSWREARRVRAFMFFVPWKARQAEELVKGELVAEQMINEEEEVAAATDWAAIIQLVIELLPQILDIFSRFGARG